MLRCYIVHLACGGHHDAVQQCDTAASQKQETPGVRQQPGSLHGSVLVAPPTLHACQATHSAH
jgi:hypothetical protein